MAKSKKRALEGAWPSLDLRCIDLDFTFSSDRVLVSLRLAVYVRSHYVPNLVLSLKRSMFFCFLFLALLGGYVQKLPLATLVQQICDIKNSLDKYSSFFFLFLFYSFVSLSLFFLLSFFPFFFPLCSSEMPKKGKKTKAAAQPDEYWVGGPHPRGGRSGPLLESTKDESGISRLYEEEEEEDYEDPFRNFPEPSAAVVRRLTSLPICADVRDLFREPAPRVAVLDEVDADDVLGSLYDQDMDAEDDDDGGDNDDGDDDDEDIDEDKEEADAGSDAAADVAGEEEVSASTSYVVVRPEATLHLP